MDIEDLLREITDIEIDINSAQRIVASAKESKGDMYIYDDYKKHHLRLDHSVIVKIAVQQLELAQSKLNKLIKAKKTAEKAIKGLLT
ncbi:hypothetical protein [Serratia symbiotica]|uniref:Uncharacterized protein n=1 Tax=Serratia symbiotica SCt-VLC TaxID=1347341 RepID=A0A068RB03_9GAMM|nr:hypothetical protein [Serratia symbiotica]CDG47868.1 hypothetical protein SCTVLC_1149 [Serratia symbiotica SCt-VLC]